MECLLLALFEEIGCMKNEIAVLYHADKISKAGEKCINSHMIKCKLVDIYVIWFLLFLLHFITLL